MNEIKLTNKEVSALVGCVNSYVRICNNATPEPSHLTEMKEDFLTQLKNVITKLENIKQYENI
jgi:hypothetical protein